MLYLVWSLSAVSQEKVERYCKQCGKVVSFEDSNKKRQNANGKDIYEYAIFKCERDHTWNKKLRTVKAFSGIENHVIEVMNQPVEEDEIQVEKMVEEEVELIHIVIESVEGRWRLDTLLSTKISGLSRSRIQKWIKRGRIQVNDAIVSSSYFIRKQDKITIRLKGEEKV
jgi:hypothetical protein